MKLADTVAEVQAAPAKPSWRQRLEHLEKQPWPQFLGILYLVRWLFLGVILLPVWCFAPDWLTMPSTEEFPPTGATLVLTLLVLAPVVETLLECTGLWWLLRAVVRHPPHRVPFMLLSAAVMVVLHPPFGLHWVPTFITGLFLAFTYSHFVRRSHGAAIAATIAFHAAINVVGVVVLMPQLMGN